MRVSDLMLPEEIALKSFYNSRDALFYSKKTFIGFSLELNSRKSSTKELSFREVLKELSGVSVTTLFPHIP